MPEWWFSLPTGMADVLVITVGMLAFGGYAYVADQIEKRRK